MVITEKNGRGFLQLSIDAFPEDRVNERNVFYYFIKIKRNIPGTKRATENIMYDVITIKSKRQDGNLVPLIEYVKGIDTQLPAQKKYYFIKNIEYYKLKI